MGGATAHDAVERLSFDERGRIGSLVGTSRGGLVDALQRSLTPLQLDELYGSMAADGLSPRTIRYTHGLLLQAYAYAQRKGLASRVAELADPPSAKVSAAGE